MLSIIFTSLNLKSKLSISVEDFPYGYIFLGDNNYFYISIISEENVSNMNIKRINLNYIQSNKFKID